jgi:hypothetical protein
MNNYSFDPSKFYLSKLCIRGHEFAEGKTLRRIKSSQCVECHRIKSLESSRRNNEKRKALSRKIYYRNRDKCIARAKEWKKNNPTWQKEYRKTPKGKAVLTKYNMKRRELTKINHSLNYTSSQLVQVYQAFDFKCCYCNKPATSLDHFIPLTKGGSDVVGNMLPSCLPCNSSKNANNPDQWYKSQSFFKKKNWQKILRYLGKSESTLGQLPLF